MKAEKQAADADGAEPDADGVEEVMVGGGRPDFQNWNTGDDLNEEAI